MDAGTPAGAHTGAPGGTDDGNNCFPPCRQAEGFITACPRCGREVRLKTLRYTHVCGRSFDLAQWAREQQAATEKSINARMASMEKPLERRAQRTEDKANKYSSLIIFLRVLRWGNTIEPERFEGDLSEYSKCRFSPCSGSN
jgi:hypothetical protein